jgi:hypothetical protein
MKTLQLETTELGLDFNAALALANVIARQQLDDDAMLLSWYDRERDYESPNGVSECHVGCATRGFWDYAVNRAARLAVAFDAGRFTFCYL